MRRSLAARISDFRRNESGATAIEYTLIIALIFLAVVAAIRGYTNTTSGMYNEIDQTLQDEIN
ncbi:Flp family type IVb pilin [Marinicaulis flavus]|uniref:Flp family type IVb pilin n=2 Tax=Hyphococcus luteus TaxID=2058213 RepID=A0A2S7K211_9PROT|nr:Flp family type IVb pilin [Marinicaulis flavus]